MNQNEEREPKHVVMFSGGVGSWRAAKRVAEEHGTENLVLLFADTRMEDEDLYRFLEEAAEDVGGQLVKVAEGRTPWETFFDSRYLGNTRIDPCSRILKRTFLRKYIDQHFDPAMDTVYLGIDAMEEHRFTRARKFWDPWTVRAPMCEAPIPPLGRTANKEALEAAGIEIPRLYTLGFQHNNCGGFCIKAGHKQFEHLLRTMPERYAYHEGQEEALRTHLAKDVAIMRDRRGGKTKPLTLRAFRERIEAEGLRDEEQNDWGGCGCFSPEDSL